MRRYTLIFLMILAAVATLSCSQSKAEQAKVEAENLLNKLSASDADARSKMGMTEFHIFGRGNVIPFWDGGAVGKTQVTQVGDTPEVFKVVVPFWCKGRSQAGEMLKLSRKLEVELRYLGEASPRWEIRNYKFAGDEPLTFWAQLQTWLFFALIAPLAILFLLQMSNPTWLQDVWTGQGMWVAWLLALGTLGIVARSAYVCFGSYIAVVICVIVYTAVITLVIAVLANVIAERRKRKRYY